MQLLLEPFVVEMRLGVQKLVKVPRLWQLLMINHGLSQQCNVGKSAEINVLYDAIAAPPDGIKQKNLLGDWAYDSDNHDADLKKQGIHLIAAHKWNRVRQKTQDSHKLKRLKKR